MRPTSISVTFILTISEPAARWGLEPSKHLRGRSLARDDTGLDNRSRNVVSSAFGRAPESIWTGVPTP